MSCYHSGGIFAENKHKCSTISFNISKTFVKLHCFNYVWYSASKTWWLWHYWKAEVKPIALIPRKTTYRCKFILHFCAPYGNLEILILKQKIILMQEVFQFLQISIPAPALTHTVLFWIVPQSLGSICDCSGKEEAGTISHGPLSKWHFSSGEDSLVFRKINIFLFICRAFVLGWHLPFKCSEYTNKPWSHCCLPYVL